MARAINSLPVPLSPVMSTLTSRGAMRPISLYTSLYRGRLPDDSLYGIVIVRRLIDCRHVNVAAYAKRLSNVLRQDPRLDRCHQVVKSTSLDGLDSLLAVGRLGIQ